jgi:Bacterial PH domain
MPDGPAASGSHAAPASVAAAFRLPRTAYLVVLFLLFGSLPLAFTGDNFSFSSAGHAQGAPAVVGWQTLALLVPVLAAVFIRRAATFVDPTGLRLRAAFGTRVLRWDDVRGLSVTGRSVYAVLAGGSVRLPCVTVQDLAAIARASGGRLPALRNPRPKYAPQRRRR